MRPTVTLASASPRRQALLQAAGVPLAVHPAHIDETPAAGEAPRDLVIRLARAKAAAVQGALVLAADTEVVLDGAVLGKPRDAAQARAMLAGLAGRAHDVLTGYCVRGRGGERAAVVATRVVFRALTPEEIAAYVATGEPLDKAGAYGIQGAGGFLVDRLEGSYTNVVGLPLAEVLQALDEVSQEKSP
jgi:septum formation protein